MKTTLTIDDALMVHLWEEASRRGTTLSELVEAAIRLLLGRPHPSREDLSELPDFDLGEAQVDVADRDALYQIMEEH